MRGPQTWARKTKLKPELLPPEPFWRFADGDISWARRGEAHVLGCICSICREHAKHARDEKRKARNKRKAKMKGQRL